MSKVVIKHPGTPASVHEVDLGMLGFRFLRSIVGGPIELVRLSKDWDMWVNGEGKLLRLTPTLWMPTDIIAGSVIVTGSNGEKTVGLQDEQVDEVVILLDAMGEALELVESRHNIIIPEE